MFRWIKVSLVILLALAFVPAVPAQAQTDPVCDIPGVQASGALYCITMPHTPVPNGGLVIFAHGYVAANEPLAIPWSQMRFVSNQGAVKYMPDVVNDLGFAFATTSYSENGLAVQQGIADILDLINVFETLVGTPNYIYLVGASEGGLITTLAIEKYPTEFSGGLAACGPIGDFRGQVNYWGDFRAVFDYFMDTPNLDVLPGNASNIPSALMKKWDSVYVPHVVGALSANPLNTGQLLAVTGALVDPFNINTIGETTLGILWYNVFATNDAIHKLGGRPFDNFDRVYSGSFNDTLLNAGVKRYQAQPAALAEIANNYETTGYLTRPLVTMHTTGDPIVPIWHQIIYRGKVDSVDPPAPYLAVDIQRYGHCAFTLDEIQQEFGRLFYMVTTGQLPPMTPMATMESAEPQVDETYYYDYH